MIASVITRLGLIRGIRGGIRCGNSYYEAFNATWPFAELLIGAEAISMRVAFYKFFVFPRNHIQSLSEYRGFFSKGVKIEHDLAEYPPFIVFWTFELDAVKSALDKDGYAITSVGDPTLPRQP